MTQITANLPMSQVPSFPVIPLKISLGLHFFKIKETSVNTFKQTSILHLQPACLEKRRRPAFERPPHVDDEYPVKMVTDHRVSPR
jgi:hypothetical protein